MDAPKDAAPPSNEDNYIAYAIAPIGSSPLNSSPSKKHGSFRQESEPRHGKWHINGVGQVIFKEHNGYTLMVQIQLGIRTSVSQIMPRKNRELQLSDINYVLKLDFPNKGSLKTPPHKQPHFLFYDYAPMAFRHLRDRFGISPTHYLTSLCHDKSLSILGTPGKSGALFFFSADMQYIIKTVTKAESKFLRKILPQYYNVRMQFTVLTIVACHV
jgi:1-phosphatidylinositol-4-phosphate 5-kinase